MKKLISVTLVFAAVLGACSTAANKTKISAAAVASPSPIPFRFPTKVLGMDVTTEDVSKEFGTVNGAYFDSMSLFGFRQNKLLRGALQVGHFNSLATPDDPKFRAGIVGQFGSTVPQPLRLGETTAYLSAGELQFQFLWFSGKWMYVLTVRRDFPFARTLLRRLLNLSLTTQ